MMKNDDGAPKALCVGCGKTPDQIPEYQKMVEEDGYSDADQAVRYNEGTYNPANGHFWCTEDYIKAGMPLGVAP